MRRKHGCVIKTSAASPTTAKKVMSHDEFNERILKSLYFGHGFYKDIQYASDITKPLAEYASELFSDSHRGHTLNRLSWFETSTFYASPTTLIMALIYLDRLNVTDPSYVRRITPRELFIVSMVISTKFYAGYDDDIDFSGWADDGNMSEDRLKQLELEFLCVIEWNIFISNEQFFEKLTSVEKILARREGLRRGWLTYSELMQMLPSFTLAKFLFKNMTIMAVSYAASVMTIAGAFFLAAQIPGTSLHRTTHSQLTSSYNDLLTQDQEMENDIKNNASTSASVFVTHVNNQTNIALNIEDELLKLERQYRELALRESLLQRNNEISTESRLTLPPQMLMAKINVNQKCAKHGQQHRQGGQWFVQKEEYSEYGKSSELGTQQLYDIDIYNQPLMIQQPRYDDSEDGAYQGFKHVGNYKPYDNTTMVSLMWHLYSTVQHITFMRLPSVWLKFM